MPVTAGGVPAKPKAVNDYDKCIAVKQNIAKASGRQR
jgi:hypothetical protein